MQVTPYGEGDQEKEKDKRRREIGAQTKENGVSRHAKLHCASGKKKNTKSQWLKRTRLISCLYCMTFFDRIEAMVISSHLHLRIQTEAVDTIWSNVLSYCHEKRRMC